MLKATLAFVLAFGALELRLMSQDLGSGRMLLLLAFDEFDREVFKLAIESANFTRPGASQERLSMFSDRKSPTQVGPGFHKVESDSFRDDFTSEGVASIFSPSPRPSDPLMLPSWRQQDGFKPVGKEAEGGFTFEEHSYDPESPQIKPPRKLPSSRFNSHEKGQEGSQGSLLHRSSQYSLTDSK